MPLNRKVLVLLLIVCLTSCSSLNTSDAVRRESMKRYVSAPRPLVLYASSDLRVDEQLRLFGMSHQLKPLIQEFSPASAMRGLVDEFISRSPVFRGTNVRIINPDEWATVQLPSDTLVLFLYGNWHLLYQRLPPDMRQFRFQAGVIGKVIPLGQVLSGKGTLALRTASWEAQCLYDAMNGDYFSVAEWRKDGASRFSQAINETQNICAEKLVRGFGL